MVFKVHSVMKKIIYKIQFNLGYAAAYIYAKIAHPDTIRNHYSGDPRGLEGIL